MAVVGSRFRALWPCLLPQSRIPIVCRLLPPCNACILPYLGRSISDRIASLLDSDQVGLRAFAPIVSALVSRGHLVVRRMYAPESDAARWAGALKQSRIYQISATYQISLYHMLYNHLSLGVKFTFWEGISWFPLASRSQALLSAVSVLSHWLEMLVISFKRGRSARSNHG